MSEAAAATAGGAATGGRAASSLGKNAPTPLTKSGRFDTARSIGFAGGLAAGAAVKVARDLKSGNVKKAVSQTLEKQEQKVLKTLKEKEEVESPAFMRFAVYGIVIAGLITALVSLILGESATGIYIMRGAMYLGLLALAVLVFTRHGGRFDYVLMLVLGLCVLLAVCTLSLSSFQQVDGVEGTRFAAYTEGVHTLGNDRRLFLLIMVVVVLIFAPFAASRLAAAPRQV